MVDKRMIFEKTFLRKFDKNILGKFSYLPSSTHSMQASLIDNILQIDSNLPCDMFNILCCNGLTDLSSIHKSVDHFRSKNLPYAFWVGFEDEPSWLEAELQKLGLLSDEMEWAMACDLPRYQEDLDLTHFSVRKVCTQEGIQDLVHIMKKIFPQHEHEAIESFYHQSAAHILLLDSRLLFFIGYEGVNPVSLVSLYFDEGLASIFDVIVLPEMRGRGLGKFMTQRAMSEAKTKGFDTCILTATNDAKQLYQKLGFVDVKTMKVYHE